MYISTYYQSIKIIIILSQVQESFEEELPYVPTTLPQERSVAMPMIPVRDRGGVLVRGVQRPRAAPPASVTVSTRAPPVAARAPPSTPAPPPPPAVTPRVQATTPPASADKLRIKLPRRQRVSSASSAQRPSRERTRSGGGDSGEFTVILTYKLASVHFCLMNRQN